MRTYTNLDVQPATSRSRLGAEAQGPCMTAICDYNRSQGLFSASTVVRTALSLVLSGCCVASPFKKVRLLTPLRLRMNYIDSMAIQSVCLASPSSHYAPNSPNVLPPRITLGIRPRLVPPHTMPTPASQSRSPASTAILVSPGA